MSFPFLVLYNFCNCFVHVCVSTIRNSSVFLLNNDGSESMLIKSTFECCQPESHVGKSCCR
jgi:hypothetical protein